MTSASLALALVAEAVAPGAPVAPVTSREPVAIVCSLPARGGFLKTDAGERAVRLFEWLAAGARLRTGAAGRAGVALRNGLRFELLEDTEVRVDAEGLATLRGSVRALPPVTPLPRLLPLAEDRLFRSRGGATRIRDTGIEGLYPSNAAVVADDATLVFLPVPGATGYVVTVQDEAGRALLRVQTPLTAVRVPAGRLAPGTRLFWSVRATGGVAASGLAAFDTLGREEAASRAALRAAVASAGDPSAWSLAAAVDLGLGLWREARTGLQAALARSPDDTELRAALAELDERLGPPR